MWQVIVPVKSWDSGKSRLEVSPAHRAEYAQAMAADTLAALGGSTLVSTVVALATSDAVERSAVSDLVDQILVHPAGMGLNEAISWAVELLPVPDGATGTVVVVADLPALTADEISHTLAMAAGQSLSMVSDRSGSGTTLLAAGVGSGLVARFGPSSAAAHRAAGAVPLDHLLPPASVAGLRCDVDTLDDLAAARSLGLGAWTRALDAGLGSPG